MKLMTASAFAETARKIATNYKTLYIYGCFGAPMNNTNKTRYCNNYAYNKQPARTNKIKNASADTFGFDCVCLIKGILWGWSGDLNRTYGGAAYKANGVPDTNADGIMNYCENVSTNFANIEVGELVHMSGHVGIYIGDGEVVECTPIWKDGVQITNLANLGKRDGYNNRTWVNHGKLTFIDYNQPVPTPEPEPVPEPTPAEEFDLLTEVKKTIRGDYGNGQERKNALGSNYEEIQKQVELNYKYGTTGWDNIKLYSSTPEPTPSPEFDLLTEVKKTIRGDYGNGQARKDALGTNYEEVQKQVDLNYKYGTTKWDNVKLY